MKLETQISGKYSPENHPVYVLKRKLQRSEIGVSFPKGDVVASFEQGFAITHPDEATLPFYSTEIAFMRAIKENPVHIVCNIYQNENNEIMEGYIGESASIETAYALTQNKPIVMVRDPRFSVKVPNDIQEIISANIKYVSIKPLDILPENEVRTELEKIISTPIQYELTDSQKSQVMRRIISLSRSYKYSWNNYKMSHSQ